MVTISLTQVEVMSIATAINDLSEVNVGPFGFNFLTILKKLKKSMMNRQYKAYIQKNIDDFVARHKLKVATYKKAGK